MSNTTLVDTIKGGVSEAVRMQFIYPRKNEHAALISQLMLDEIEHPTIYSTSFFTCHDHQAWDLPFCLLLSVCIYIYEHTSQKKQPQLVVDGMHLNMTVRSIVIHVFPAKPYSRQQKRNIEIAEHAHTQFVPPNRIQSTEPCYFLLSSAKKKLAEKKSEGRNGVNN